VIFASYSDDLGVRTNNSIQRMLDSDLFKSVFPEIRLGERTEIWRRNASLLEFAGREGSFRNVTVEGAINGMELSFGVIDDPHKGRNEALSKATRDKVWNWFTDDWMARFSTNSAMLVIATRWHIDDLIGRYLERDPDMKIVSYPAIAEKDEFWQDTASRCAVSARRHRLRTRRRPSEGARLRRAGVRRPRQRRPGRRRRRRSGVRCHRRRHREAVRRPDPSRRNAGDHRRPDRGTACRWPDDRLCSRVRSRPTE
jgi:hypothetical protein